MAGPAADIQVPEAPSSAVQTAKDLFSGAAGGIAQVLIGGQPLPPFPAYLPKYMHTSYHLFEKTQHRRKKNK